MSVIIYTYKEGAIKQYKNGVIKYNTDDCSKLYVKDNRGIETILKRFEYLQTCVSVILIDKYQKVATFYNKEYIEKAVKRVKRLKRIGSY
jgi:hypothetical protein